MGRFWVQTAFYVKAISRGGRRDLDWPGPWDTPGRAGHRLVTSPMRQPQRVLLEKPKTWFGQGLLTRPCSATVGLPVLDHRCVTWRPLVGRAAGSGDPRRTGHLCWSQVSPTVFSDLSPCSQ